MNHLDRLKSGIEHWNQWRLSTAQNGTNAACDLSGLDLSQGYFFEGDFSGANLTGADLTRACLIGADLTGADLTNADLTGAYLGDANLYGANLTNANLTKANLERANLQAANLFGTQFTDADIRTTQLPKATTAPYTDATLNSLIKGQLKSQQPLAHTHSAPRTVQRFIEKPAPTAATAAFRQSLLAQMRTNLASLAPEKPDSAMRRQQAIRQSAAPLQAQTVKSSWGRRQTDQRLTAQIRWHIGRRRVWMPVVAATLLLVGLPLGLISLRSQEVVAQSQQAAPLALTKSLTAASQVWAVAAKPETKGAAWVIGGKANGQIEVWDAQTGELLRSLSGHEDGVRSLAVSTSGQWLVSGSRSSLKVWQLDTGKLAYSSSQTSDSSRFTIRQWNLASTQLLTEFTGHKNTVRTVALDPNGTMFVSGEPQPPTAP